MGHMGSSINHVVTFLGIFDSPPPSWSLLLYKSYVIKWSFGQPPSPSTVHVVYECPPWYFFYAFSASANHLLVSPKKGTTVTTKLARRGTENIRKTQELFLKDTY